MWLIIQHFYVKINLVSLVKFRQLSFVNFRQRSGLTLFPLFDDSYAKRNSSLAFVPSQTSIEKGFFSLMQR